MLGLARRRRGIVFTFLILLLLPVACGPTNSDFGGDPCLLQQYQSKASSIVGRIQGAYNTLSGQVDALQPPNYTIAATQDFSETLNAFTQFGYRLDAQMNALQNQIAHPQEGATAENDTGHAADLLRQGAQLLSQAYVDASQGNVRAATDIATAARIPLDQGGNTLLKAQAELALIKTFSPNC